MLSQLCNFRLANLTTVCTLVSRWIDSRFLQERYFLYDIVPTWRRRRIWRVKSRGRYITISRFMLVCVTVLRIQCVKWVGRATSLDFSMACERMYTSPLKWGCAVCDRQGLQQTLFLGAPALCSWRIMQIAKVDETLASYQFLLQDEEFHLIETKALS